MGKFAKGHKKIEGSGMKNGQKTQRSLQTEEIRGWFAGFLSERRGEIDALFDGLESREKLDFLLKVARMVLPAQQAVDVNATVGEHRLTIEDRLKELDCGD